VKRLVWIEPPQDGDCHDWAKAAEDAIDAAPEPVKRERCITPDHQHAEYLTGTHPSLGKRCWFSLGEENEGEDVSPCVFTTVYEVPAPEEAS
jgi:hypothetical protein